MMPLTNAAAALEQESPASHEDPSGIRRIHGTAGSASPCLTIDLTLTSESQLYAGLSGDMSEGGVFIETYRNLPLGTMVELDIAQTKDGDVAVFELLWVDDVPDAVVLDEAVALAKALSTDDSPRFVNGVLGAVLDAEVPAG